MHVLVDTADLPVQAMAIELRRPTEAESMRAISDVMRRMNAARTCNLCGWHYTGCVARGRCGRKEVGHTIAALTMDEDGDMTPLIEDISALEPSREETYWHGLAEASNTMFPNDPEPTADAFDMAPLRCHCGLPVASYQVRRMTANHGRWFLRCPRDQRTENQCSYFEWVSSAEAVSTTEADGITAMHFTICEDSEEGRVMLDCDSSKEGDAAMYFETSEGGAIVFKHGA